MSSFESTLHVSQEKSNPTKTNRSTSTGKHVQRSQLSTPRILIFNLQGEIFYQNKYREPCSNSEAFKVSVHPTWSKLPYRHKLVVRKSNINSAKHHGTAGKTNFRDMENCDSALM